jgi:phage/plasmid-like protein (TIGR03299 family)
MALLSDRLTGANDFATAQWSAPDSIFDQAADTSLSAGIDVPTAFAAADCAYTVAKVPVMTPDGHQVPDAFTIIRTDTFKPFRVIVSDRYQPIQVGVLQDVCEQLSDRATLQHICNLRDGARVAFTMKINDVAGSVGSPEDVLQPYVVGMTAHDGSMALRVQYTAIRVWCGNTMWLAVSEGNARNSIVIPHIGNAAEAAALLPSTMDVAARSFNATVDQLRAMAQVRCSDEQFRGFLEQLYADELKPEVDADGNERRKELEGVRAARAMLHKWQAGYLGHEQGGLGTWYAALNCVTEQLTHVSEASTIETARRKLESTLMGDTQWRLEQAHSLALAGTR